MPRLTVFVITLLLSLGLRAQVMPFKNYGIKDGLNDNNVQAVIRDDRGLLWVGTDVSLYWFDGKTFYQPRLKTTIGQLYIDGFYKDWHGDIWILTLFNGLYRYHNGGFTNYLVDTVLKEATTNSVTDLTQVADNKYIAVSCGCAYLFGNERFSIFDSANNVLVNHTNSVSQLPDGTILFSTDSGVYLYQYTNGKFKYVKHALENIIANKILVTKKRSYLVKSKGLSSFQNDGSSTFDYPVQSYLDNKSISDIAATGDDGKVWILSDSLYKIENGDITIYSSWNGLPDNIVHLFCDREGLLWLGHRKGIAMMSDEYYDFTPLKNELQDLTVFPINTDAKNNIWIGTGDGLATKSGDGYKYFATVGKQPIGYISGFYKNREGVLLAITNAGVLNMDEKPITIEYNAQATAIAEDESNGMWFGDIGGHIWKSQGKLIIPLKTDHFFSGMITALYVENGIVWVGYRDSGIRKYKLSNDSLLLIKEYNTTSGFNDVRVRNCTTDKKGNILFGTRTNGLFIISRSGGQLVAHITSENGLNANWIKDILCDTDGTVYLATNGGINILSGDYKGPVVKQLKISNEGLNKETNCILKTGNIFYIGTNEGVLKWMPENMHKDTTALPVYFTHIDIQGLDSFSIAPYTQDAGEISLPHDQHIISFRFAGISLKDPENVRYQYMLQGQDKSWSNPTEYNYVAYNLKPGHYTFKVIAINGDGIISRQAAVFHFIIQPPFWASWWFITMMILAAVAAVYTAYRYKLREALAVEQLRNKISTDLHDDIGSTLSSISILSDMALKEPSHTYVLGMIKGIKENSTFLLEKMDDIVWSINPKNDTLENLMIRMQRFAAALLEAKNIDYTIDIAPSIKKVKLTMNWRQHIYLILKEAINNLVKYSNATTAHIWVAYQNNILKITIQDNGAGFDSNARHLGNGIINMRQRAKLMNATLTIDSKQGSGTIIVFSLKIK